MQAFCHWSGVKCWWSSSSVVSSLSWVEFSSKNVILNISRFSGGMGFSILVDEVLVEGGGLAISVLCGMCKVTG